MSLFFDSARNKSCRNCGEIHYSAKGTQSNHGQRAVAVMGEVGLDDTMADAALMEFKKDNPEKGTLRVQAFRGNKVLPVANVYVKVSKVLDGKPYVFFEGETDASGIIDPIILPAPPKAFSLDPSSERKAATYLLQAEHPQFLPIEKEVCIYPDIKSIQQLLMNL